jgi:hypothetical protein
MPGIYTDSSTGGGGTVLVTAYGGNQSCNPARWLIDSGGVHVYVECFNPAGSASDALFDALYYRRGNGWFQAYVWANNATASSYIPYLAYQWNSVGLTNSITRSGTGSYVVTIPGFPWNTGTVAVSAYGGLSRRCKSTGWYASSSNMLVGVACTNGGQPADAQFTLTFTNTLELGSTGAYLGAFAWADQPTNPSCYTPATSYQYNFEASPLTACRTALGHYAVYIPHAPNSVGGNQTTVLTTAYAGPSGSYCNVQNWITYSSEWVAYVSCYDSAGNSLDSKYTVQLLTDDLYNIP